jgi:hypothetical protein
VQEEAMKDPWADFHEGIKYTDKTPVMICKKCERVFAHPYTKKDKSNSALWKHLRNKHNYNSGPTLDPPPSATIDALFTCATGITTPELQRVLLQTMATCNWPFDQFDNLIFRHLLHRGFPGHKLPCRCTMARLLKIAAQTARGEIKERFAEDDGSISLALDCWTSSNRWEFMGTFSP